MQVAPFKSQNMALNSAVTPEGGEIGRAQAVQAAACGIPPHTDMNPVLLKPNSDTGSQVIVQGQAGGKHAVREYKAFKPEAFAEHPGKLPPPVVPLATSSSSKGPGASPRSTCKAHDIANLKVAGMAGARSSWSPTSTAAAYSPRSSAPWNS